MLLLCKWPLLSASAQDASVTRLTTEDCRLFAERLCACVAKYDVAAGNDCFDVEAISSRYLDGVEFRYRSDAGSTKWELPFNSPALLHLPFEVVARGGSFDLLRIKAPGDWRPGDSVHLVMRVVAKNGTLTYLALTLQARESRGPMITRADTHGAVSAAEAFKLLVTQFAQYDGPDGKIASEAPNAEERIQDKKVFAPMHARRDFRLTDVSDRDLHDILA